MLIGTLIRGLDFREGASCDMEDPFVEDFRYYPLPAVLIHSLLKIQIVHKFQLEPIFSDQRKNGGREHVMRCLRKLNAHLL